MAEDNTEGSSHSQDALKTDGEQPKPSWLRRIFGGKPGEQPTATTITSPPESKVVHSPWVQRVKEGKLPAKVLYEPVEPKKPKQVWGED